ncbi:hypothetical protein [Capnocytophaga canimorsus]|uniref:hypothetical protein n=1 Tax=Capnocytophaga canimorsus TaxID=28188 RepID=UPI001F509F04|nr:hypothetical protein [Capnocytophaga canimorsus]
MLGNNPNFYAYVFDSNTEVDIFGLDCSKIKTKAITEYYPPNGGALGKWEREFLMPGTRIDRFGSGFGKYGISN